MAKLRLTNVEEESEWSAELSRDPIELDDITWEWLKGAFKAIGFSDEQVEAWFNGN